MSPADFVEASRLLRARIDEVDRRLAALLADRLALAAEIGALKRASGRDIVDTEREAEIRAGVLAAAAGGLSEPEVRVFYDALLRLSRARAAGAPE